jgi:hypothetical protein
MPTRIWPIEGEVLNAAGDLVAESLAGVALDVQTTVGTIETATGDIASVKAVTDALPDAGALTSISDETDKIDGAATDGLVGTSNSLAYRVHEIEKHVHSRGRFWGATGAPDETNAIAATVTVPFVAVSGANTWGTAIPICGTADQPVPAGEVKFDAHLLLVVDTDHATPYRIRIIYGTGTSADAITAGQWSETMFITATGPFSSGVPVAINMLRVNVGWKCWVQVWNNTNGSNVDLYWGGHGYAG